MKELIEKLEQARAGGRDLDEAIARAVGGLSEFQQHIDIARKMVSEGRGHEYIPTGDDRRLRAECVAESCVFAPPYTTSIDAALALVPVDQKKPDWGGWYWRAGRGTEKPGWAHLNRWHPSHCNPEDEVTAYSATPALALCAAALKARAAT